MIKKLIIAVVGIAAILGTLYWIKSSQRAAVAESGGMMPGPAAVTTAVAEMRMWTDEIDAIGSLEAIQGVSISSEISGLIAAIHFESGQQVEAGDLLVELDVTSETAQLDASKAQAQLAKIRLDRTKELRAMNTLAQSELDTAEAQYAEAQARAANLESLIEKKRIRAPFTGRLGIRKVNVGQYLNAGVGVVSLQRLDSVFVNFTLPQQRISMVRKGMPISMSVDAFPGETFEGKLTTIAPEVSQSTRSLSLQATLSNPDQRLLPGMFAQVRIAIADERPSLALPATAVVFAPYGDSVYVVQETERGKAATQKFIRVGKRQGDFVSVESGLEEGDVVVSTGAFKLRNGMPIVENNAFAPEAKFAPKPEDS